MGASSSSSKTNPDPAPPAAPAAPPPPNVGNNQNRPPPAKSSPWSEGDVAVLKRWQTSEKDARAIAFLRKLVETEKMGVDLGPSVMDLLSSREEWRDFNLCLVRLLQLVKIPGVENIKLFVVPKDDPRGPLEECDWSMEKITTTVAELTTKVGSASGPFRDAKSRLKVLTELILALK